MLIHIVYVVIMSFKYPYITKIIIMCDGIKFKLSIKIIKYSWNMWISGIL